MKITVNKSNLRGRVTVPSSKSITIRALFCAALARGESQIIRPLVSDDTNYAADVLGKVGVMIQDIDGVWHVTGGKFKLPTEELYCGESATTLRMMTAVAALLPGKITITGGPSLTQRPIRALVDALKMLGVRGNTATPLNPPVTIQGGTFRGGIAEIPGNVSSQYITALLTIGSFAPVETVIKLTTPLTSRPYILMTQQVLNKFNISIKPEGNNFRVTRQRYEPCNITVEGDWSSASYFLALGALSEEGVLVENISTSSRQGDRVILDILRNMGAEVRVIGNSVAVKKGEDYLKPVSLDLSDCIDLFPTVAVLCSLTNGQSELRGIQRARIKESNRVTSMREGLQKLGVGFAEYKEYCTIKGLNIEKKEEDAGTAENMLENPEDFYEEEAKPQEIVVDSYNDHRIAMAFAIMGAYMGNVTILNAECVKKTYPEFWKSFRNLGGEFQAYE